jgi:hypothetical protein
MNRGAPMRRLAILVLLASAAGCRAPISGTVGQPVALPVGQVATYDSIDLDLAFRRVVTDSRCPRGATCVWAGEAVVTAEARLRGGAPRTLELRLSAESDTTDGEPVGGHRVRLLALEPHPSTASPPDSAAYVGTFLVERR